MPSIFDKHTSPLLKTVTEIGKRLESGNVIAILAAQSPRIKDIAAKSFLGAAKTRMHAASTFSENQN
jgi:hypothetical protein